jgi:hypothetical protein
MRKAKQPQTVIDVDDIGSVAFSQPVLGILSLGVAARMRYTSCSSLIRLCSWFAGGRDR